MKFLLLVLVLVVAYAVWRSSRERERAEHAPAPPKAPRQPALPQDMVSCPVCGLHLPRDEALAGASGRLYCGPDHRRIGGN
ncbi:PP0621 family protein [Ramlibacter algicola]|uniref:Preprotein translocase subunit YajC n=1 Tax=Ramlibacter algicola TaxID=2795217 RepID=A0A934UQD5_9BURK|nr:PP0621 family protein [Ramlibacter algicola]MBK0391706.1 hypothetical protein [Ramlibacter algicola]